MINPIIHSLLLIAVVISPVSIADLYKCIDTNGQITFTDQACIQSGDTFKPKPIMTNYKSISFTQKRVSTKKTGSNKNIKMKSACACLTSTELRNLRVKQEYKKGMASTEIKKRYGKPNQITSSGNNKEKWEYKDKRFNRAFSFSNGCLTSWKKKAVGKKSKIYTD
jgi:hypothetical protein